MANELGGEGLDIGGQPREDINKVTEEAVRRIQEEAKQAQQIQKDIKQDKATNNKLAEFLTFLMKNLANDHLLKLLYDLFFKTKHPNTGVTYLRKKINIIVIVGLFYPFYLEKGKEFGINLFFEDLSQHGTTLTVPLYLAYIKKLSAKYHDNVPLDLDMLIHFLVEIIHQFGLLDIKALPEEEQKEFVHQLKRELSA